MLSVIGRTYFTTPSESLHSEVIECKGGEGLCMVLEHPNIRKMGNRAQCPS